MYKFLLKPVLFLLSPERAHHFTMRCLKLAFGLPIISWIWSKSLAFSDPLLEVSLFGLHFKNPVGLAAGFDKDGKYIRELAGLGFGFVELGTVTPRPQPGNPPPRLFRLPGSRALINRMGFNNEGVVHLMKKLEKFDRKGLVIGGNIGKNKDTPNENAVDDYLYCFETLYPYVDYFVVNVSSPNTPGLRELQEKEPLQKLLNSLQDANNKKQKPKPVLLKISPDLEEAALDDIIEIVQLTGLSGIIATNTTIGRDGLHESMEIIENTGSGGLSGAPLREKSTSIIRYIHEKSGGKIPVIAVGGIFSGKDALEKVRAGASLVQVYTGMIYEGPALIKKMNKAIYESKKQALNTPSNRRISTP